MRILNKLLSAISAAAVFAAALPLGASAEDPDLYLTGKVYEYSEKHAYTVSSYYYLDKTSELDTIGQLSVSGKMVGSATEENVAAFEVPLYEDLVIEYTYNNDLFRSDKFNWHIVDDSATEIDGISIGGRIGSGAVILLTSYDRVNWTLNDAKLDITRSLGDQFETKTFTTNSVQLVNGCYYRVIAAYMLEEQLDDTRFWFFDTSDKDRKRVAEVYEFYAGYGASDEQGQPTSGRSTNLGETVSAGLDNGYTGSSSIPQKDPHYGWQLGNFSVSGYSEAAEGNVFIKSPEDKISLSFFLRQYNVDRLNGDSDLSIESDTVGTDSYFGLAAEYFGRGALIIRYTDPLGVKQAPQVFPDFLTTLATPGAETQIELLDEGDYEAALDYRIREDGFFYDSLYDYKIFFTFKVRNSGCTVSASSLKDRSELTSQTGLSAMLTEDGFKLTGLSSGYLDINVTLTQYSETDNGYTKSEVFSRAPSPDEQFTQSGLYTVTAYNPATDPLADDLVDFTVYNGDDLVVIASLNEANSALSLDEIAAKVEDGAKISPQGIITEPVKTATTTVETRTVEAAAPEITAAQTEAEKAIAEAELASEADEKNRSVIKITLIVISLAVAAIAATAVLVYYQDTEKSKLLRRKHRNAEDTEE